MVRKDGKSYKGRASGRRQIGLEIVRDLLGARDSSGFKRFLDTITWPLLAPFKGLLPTRSAGA